MTAAAIIATLRARGVILEPHGDRLRVRPASAVTSDEVEALRRLKAEVLEILTPASPARHSVRWWSYPWPDALPGIGTRTVGPFDTCEECAVWSWVRYGVTVFCLACARRHVQEPRL